MEDRNRRVEIGGDIDRVMYKKFCKKGSLKNQCMKSVFIITGTPVPM